MIIYSEAWDGRALGGLVILVGLYWVRRELRWTIITTDHVSTRGLLLHHRQDITAANSWDVHNKGALANLWILRLLKDDDVQYEFEAQRKMSEQEAIDFAKRVLPERLLKARDETP